MKRSFGKTEGIDYDCPLCGWYTLSNRVIYFFENSGLGNTGEKTDIITLRSMLFYFLRVILKNHAKQGHRQVPRFATNGDYFNYEEQLFSLEVIYNKYYPQTFSKKIDMVMELLSTVIDKFSDFFIMDVGSSMSTGQTNTLKRQHHFFWLPSGNDVSSLDNQERDTIDLLKELGYINAVTKDIPSNGFIIKKDVLKFTAKGWQKLEKQSRKSNAVFIAMAFSPPSKEEAEKEEQQKIIDKLEGCIKTALNDTAYTPMIIKDKQHTNYIMTEIINEIENAAFVIADLTYQKTGVYFEAGYAKALGKEVIMTCHTSDFENRHFDVAQHNTIVWDIGEEKEKEFIDRLRKMILAIDDRLNPK